MKDRIKWIDVAKGLGIIMVMLGHLNINNTLKIIIYMFHMPLFFYLSGYTFNCFKFKNFSTFVKDKFFKLFLPGAILSIICSLISLIFFDKISSIKSLILGLFLQLRGQDFCFLWFTTCLFITECLLGFILRYIKNSFKQLCLVVITFFLSSMYISFIGKPLPFSIDIVGIALLFLFIGYHYKIKKLLDYFTNRIFISLFLFISGILIGILNFKISDNTMTDLYMDFIGNGFLFFISAVLLIFGFIGFCKKNINMNIIIFIGKNSLCFYACHRLAYSFVNIFTDNYFIIFIVSIIILMPFSIFIDNFILKKMIKFLYIERND